jgi:hypothetical protein
MLRAELRLALIEWGWNPLPGFEFSIKDYSINIEGWAINRGFYVMGPSGTPPLWVSEEDLKKNVAYKFFIRNISKVSLNVHEFA